MRIPRKVPEILMDGKLIEEAFLNFLLNAMDAMPKGGLLSVTSSYVSETKEVIISFADSGCGISEDNLIRVFEPFFTTKKEGTGLGLYLARQIIELHKGKVHIKSKIDHGTDVTIRFPAYNETV